MTKMVGGNCKVFELLIMGTAHHAYRHLRIPDQIEVVDSWGVTSN